MLPRSAVSMPPPVRVVPAAKLPSGYPEVPRRTFKQPVSVVKYQLDVEKLLVCKPWYAAAVRHWVTELGDSEETRYFVYCKLHTQVDSTQRGYAGKYIEWEVDFCLPRGLCPLPATRATALKYIGWQAKKATVQGTSLGQYFAAVNCAHADCGFPLPFDGGADIRSAVKGMSLLQATVGPEVIKSQRVYLPAENVVLVLDDVLQYSAAIDPTDRDLCNRFRDDVAFVFNYVDFGRSDTQSGMLESDVAVSDDGRLFFVLRKQKGKAAKLSLATFQWPPQAVPDVVNLIRRWFALRRSLDCPETGLMWRLPWDRSKFDGVFFDSLLRRVLARRGRAAPAPFVWTGHSSRAGAASEATAIDVMYDKLCFTGGWAIGSDTPRLTYIDFSCPPSPAGFRLFGWLRPAQPALPS